MTHAKHRSDSISSAGELTIRLSTPADRRAIAELAELDSRAVPSGHLLLAETLGGGLIAALSLDGHGLIADPFRQSAGAVTLLRLRARQILDSPGAQAGPRPRGRGARIWAGLVRGAGAVPLAGR